MHFIFETMKGFITVTVDKNSGKKGIINISAIVYAEPFPNDAGATTIYLGSSGNGQQGFQVVVDETLDNVIALIKQAQ